jgi:hypothetical protein
MNRFAKQGVGIGAVVAIVAWLEEPAGTRVSTFPGILSLVMLAAFTAYAVWKISRRERVRPTASLGVAAGVVIGLSHVVRAAMRWTTADPLMLTTSFAASILAVMVVTALAALFAPYDPPMTTNGAQ